MKQDNQGFTLIEVLFVVIILPILFLTVFTVMESANVISRTNGVFAQLNQSEMQTLRSISREIGQTSPDITPARLILGADAANNSIVTFQIPVDCDNDGDVMAGEGTSCVNNPSNDKYVEWGAYNEAGQFQNGRLGAWTRYSVNNNQLVREVLSANQVPIAGLRRVVANNVQSFRVTQALNALTMTLTANATDTIGQAGKPRTLQTTFASNTVLRNAIA